jgi:uncharacterized membrane protein
MLLLLRALVRLNPPAMLATGLSVLVGYPVFAIPPNLLSINQKLLFRGNLYHFLPSRGE